MVTQVYLPEVTHVRPYLQWMNEKTECQYDLGNILMETEFRWTVEDDKNRAEDGLKWRERYAEDAGNGLSDVQRDRIRKSIHGKCSCYEVILSLANEINAMVNEEEEDRTKEFFHILLENLQIGHYDDEDFDYRNSETDKQIRKILEQWMDGDEKRCIFPIPKVSQCDRKVSQSGSLWMQMNRWIEACSDENGQFVTEKCHSVTVSK